MSQAELDMLFRQAVLLHQSGRLEEASREFDRLLAHAPGHPALLTCAGVVALQRGQMERAESLLGQSLAAAPNQPEALLGRGVALQNLGRSSEALACFDQAIALRPQYAEAYANRGHALLSLRRFDDALASCDRAIELNPGMADAHANRGVALLELGRVDEALESCDRAIALQPGVAGFYSNRANILQKLRRWGEALAATERAVALNPGLAEAHSNRGCALQVLNRLDEALASFERAVSLRADYAPAQFNKAIIKLLTGDFAEGWRLYEWRWQADCRDYVRHFPQPLWLGDAPLAGKTLLIHAEQGFGDFIQFCRYIPMAEALGAKVVVEVFPALIPLISSLKGSFSLVPAGQPLPAFDFHCPVMSLPLAFHTTVQSIPASVPYLFADPARLDLWRQRLGPKSRMRVGIAWSGNPTHKNDLNRSIPLRLLLPLLALPLEFHVLQKDIRPEDAAELARFANVRVHSANLGDFADTAALVQEMDLVISVDTSVAHVAGAMNRPLWLLLPFNPDFRWFLDRSDSPWYPSATLFRQPAIGDWASVIADVAARLASSAQDAGSSIGQ